ncbi:MAG: hypothetical protein R3F59_26925 [Myxococcota bacterium]
MGRGVRPGPRAAQHVYEIELLEDVRGGGGFCVKGESIHRI